VSRQNVQRIAWLFAAAAYRTVASSPHEGDAVQGTRPDGKMIAAVALSADGCCAAGHSIWSAFSSRLLPQAYGYMRSAIAAVWQGPEMFKRNVAPGGFIADVLARTGLSRCLDSPSS
jgi:hypothetical protein